MNHELNFKKSYDLSDLYDLHLNQVTIDGKITNLTGNESWFELTPGHILFLRFDEDNEEFHVSSNKNFDSDLHLSLVSTTSR